MAPSRALLLFTRLRASPRALPSPRRTLTSTTLTHRSPFHPSLSPSPRTRPAFSPSSRGYATSTPDPPDYLNEAELHIFNKIKAELQPVNLEVRLAAHKDRYTAYSRYTLHCVRIGVMRRC